MTLKATLADLAGGVTQSAVLLEAELRAQVAEKDALIATLT